MCKGRGDVVFLCGGIGVMKQSLDEVGWVGVIVHGDVGLFGGLL